ncbi:DC-STAMP domain-containing protein 2 [Aedes aegypti]|uniref:Dendritic cell-specific transmembrane protein-like domain-containing protein n=2 Tax=Aedes aegypti TaxID=7159 RepID=A0A903U864_AEDAE|nr:DC-STAMP domain-containing protein 2 [Aedes aegypti]
MSHRNSSQTTRRSKLRRKTRKFAIGLALGLFKTATLYILLRHQLGISRKTTCIAAAILGTLFTIQSCWSSSFQCVTLLMVPQILSKRGRATTIAYVFVLAMNGPARNTIANVDRLGRALSCSQDRLKSAMHDALQAVKVPFLAMKKAIGVILSEVEKAFMKIQRILIQIMRLVKRILSSIKRGFNWLGNIAAVCNQKNGTPFDQCIRSLESAVEDCKQKLGVVDFMCEVTHVAKVVCYSVKVVDYMCELIDFVSDQIVETIEKKLQEFIHNIQVMFRVKVDFDHSFEFQTNFSRNYTDIVSAITQEINHRSRYLFTLFNVFTIVSSFCFICVVIRSVRYKMKYLTKDSFDNFYISRDFIAIDEHRRSMNRDTVLPLTRKERNRYIHLTSMSLIRKEKLRIARSAVFLFISSIHILGLMAADYCLYWLLALIRHVFLRQADIERPPMVTLEVSGSGIIADMYRGIVGAFEPMVKHADILDPARCAPDPKTPDFIRYLQISLLLLFCWMCIVLEPYGLRIRQIIMRAYYPDRAKERATWLYNDVLLKRESFVKILRRQLGLGSGDSKPRKLMDIFRAKTNLFWICRKILGSNGGGKKCIFCSERIAENEAVSCLRPGCVGVYCYECFVEIQNLCTICSEPMDSSDQSDISIERFE